MMRPSLMIRFFAWLRGGEVVIARTESGEVFFTIMYVTPFGLQAHRYWWERIGGFWCAPNGGVPNHYVKEWRRVS